MRVRVYFEDGSSALLEGEPHGWSPYASSQEIALEAIERPWAIENGEPQWLVQLSLRGHDALLEHVATVTVTATAEDGSTRPVELVRGGTAEFVTSVPLRFDATVTYDESIHRPADALNAVATTDTPIPSEPLAARSLYLGAPYIEPNPLADPSMMEEPASWFGIGLKGWERELRRIVHVDWSDADLDGRRFVDDYQPQTFHVTERDGGPIDAFGYRVNTVWANSEITATVQFEGGAEPLVLPMLRFDDSVYGGPAYARRTVARWGTDDDGSPVWWMEVLDTDTVVSAVPREFARYKLSIAKGPLEAWSHAPATLRRLYVEDGASVGTLVSPFRPACVAEVVLKDPGSLFRADGLRMESRNGWSAPSFRRDGFMESRSDSYAGVPEDPGPDQLVVKVTPWAPSDGPSKAVSPTAWVIGLDGPLSLSASAASAVVLLRVDGQEHRLEPSAVSGHGHHRFDIRWLGPRPEAVTIQLSDKDGAITAQVDG